MPIGATNGQPDSYFLSRVRRQIRDQPVWRQQQLAADGVLGALGATSKPFRLKEIPVYVPLAGGGVAYVKEGGTTYTPVFDTVPTGSQVEFVTETGELIFPIAPTSGTINVAYQSTRFTDTQVFEALTEGLNLLWPEIWNPQVDSTSILLSPTQFEYALPASFQDQRTVLLDVEFQPPSGIVRSFRTTTWRVRDDVTSPKLVLGRILPVGSLCLLKYATTFNALASVPVQAMHLPVYYAICRLLIDGETMRNRADDLPAQTAENANVAGAIRDTAEYWFQKYLQEVQRLSMGEPARESLPAKAAERLGLPSYWADAV